MNMVITSYTSSQILIACTVKLLIAAEVGEVG